MELDPECVSCSIALKAEQFKSPRIHERSVSLPSTQSDGIEPDSESPAVLHSAVSPYLPHFAGLVHLQVRCLDLR